MNLAKKIVSCMMGGMLSVCFIPGFKAMDKPSLIALSASQRAFFDAYKDFSFTDHFYEEGKTESQILYENLKDFLLRGEEFLCVVLQHKDAELQHQLYVNAANSVVNPSIIKLACEFLLREGASSLIDRGWAMVCGTCKCDSNCNLAFINFLKDVADLYMEKSGCESSVSNLVSKLEEASEPLIDTKWCVVNGFFDEWKGQLAGLIEDGTFSSEAMA